MTYFRNVVTGTLLSLSALVSACATAPPTAEQREDLSRIEPQVMVSERAWPTSAEGLREAIETIEDARAFQDILEYDHARVEHASDEELLMSIPLLRERERGVCRDAAAVFAACLQDDYDDVVYLSLGSIKASSHAVVAINDGTAWKSAGINDCDECQAPTLRELALEVYSAFGCPDSNFWFMAYSLRNLKLDEGWVSKDSFDELAVIRTAGNLHEQREKPAFYWRRGMQREQAGNLVGAIGDYTTAIDTYDSWDGVGLADLLTRRYELRRSLDDVDGIKRDVQKGRDFFGRLAQEKEREKRWDQAIELHELLFKTAPEEYSALHLVRCHLFSEQYEGVVYWASHAIEQGELVGQVYKVRSVAYEQLGDYDQAIKEMDMAIAEDPSNEYYLYRRATLRAEVGENEGARQDYARAEELRQ